MDDSRFDRIEKKLDDMSEAIVSLARMEERMLSLFKRMDHYDSIQREISQRVSVVETGQGISGQTLRFAERVFWIVVAAGVTFYFKGSAT